jgi:hypothetical protein
VRERPPSIHSVVARNRNRARSGCPLMAFTVLTSWSTFTPFTVLGALITYPPLLCRISTKDRVGAKDRKKSTGKAPSKQSFYSKGFPRILP